MEDPIRECVGFRLAAAHRRLDRLFNRTYERIGLSHAHGQVLIAAITSCTNTSNPSVMVAAGLVARKAVERGLSVNPLILYGWHLRNSPIRLAARPASQSRSRPSCNQAQDAPAKDFCCRYRRDHGRLARKP